MKDLLDPKGSSLVEDSPVGGPLEAGDVEEDPGTGGVVDEGTVFTHNDDIAHVGPHGLPVTGWSDF